MRVIKYINPNMNNYDEKRLLSYRQNKRNNTYKQIFPKISNSLSSRENINIYINKFKNIKIKKELTKNINENNDKKKNYNNINKTFYKIKRRMNFIFPHSKSSININNKKIYKNVFNAESFQKIKDKIYNNQINLEYNNKKKKYELLLYSLIKNDKNPIKNEVNIKNNFINKINENVKKNNKIRLKLLNNEILNKFKKNNYKNFKRDISHSLKKKRKKNMENKIQILIDSAESKFDEIFSNIFGKELLFLNNKINI